MERDEKGRFKRKSDSGGSTAEEKVYAVGFKGFGPGMVCRGKQYAENTVFEEPEAVMCKSGMHFCENPMDVLGYYGFLDDNANFNEFAPVEALAPIKTDGEKSVTTKIRIGAKLDIAGFVKAAVDFVFARAKKIKGNHATGYKGAASATGNWGGAASATGDWSAASATGYKGAASATGYKGAASATGNCGAASATGDWSAASATGYNGAASATGDESFAIATGIQGKVKGALGCFIACAEWEEDQKGKWHPVRFISAKVDGKTIKADTWYKVENGKFKEVEE